LSLKGQSITASAGRTWQPGNAQAPR